MEVNGQLHSPSDLPHEKITWYSPQPSAMALSYPTCSNRNGRVMNAEYSALYYSVFSLEIVVWSPSLPCAELACTVRRNISLKCTITHFKMSKKQVSGKSFDILSRGYNSVNSVNSFINKSIASSTKKSSYVMHRKNSVRTCVHKCIQTQDEPE